MLAAPIAYSANFRTNTYAEVNGAWVVVERLVGHGTTSSSTVPFYADFFVGGYVVITVASTAMLLYTLLLGGDDRRRTFLLVYSTGLLFFQLCWGLAVYFHANDFVGAAAEGYVENGIQREFSLHFFILLFTWSAKRRYRKAYERLLAGNQTPAAVDA